MYKEGSIKEFDVKFSQLNPDNQRYIIAIQQALIFAQSTKQSAVPKEDSLEQKGL